MADPQALLLAISDALDAVAHATRNFDPAFLADKFGLTPETVWDRYLCHAPSRCNSWPDSNLCATQLSLFAFAING